MSSTRLEEGNLEVNASIVVAAIPLLLLFCCTHRLDVLRYTWYTHKRINGIDRFDKSKHT